MRSDLFAEANAEVESTGLFTRQNSKMLKASLASGSLRARHGSMVAYQGQVSCEHEGLTFDSDGLKKLLKKAVSGEGLDLMRVSGSGEVFFADMGADVHVIDLEDDAISINGMNVLAFDGNLDWDIQLVRSAGMMAGGLFNTTISGRGQVAVTTQGTPVVLDAASAPTFADPDAVVCWSAGLQLSPQVSETFKSFIGRDSGEGMQLAFSGQGIVVVQPSETMRYGGGQRKDDAEAEQGNSNPLGGIGRLLGG